MKIYNYDPASGAFINESAADPSPFEEGVFLMPAHATDIEPPACGEHEIPLFANNAWTVKPDYRGVALFDTKNGTHASIEDIGVTPADKGLTELAPLETPCKWDTKKQKWMDDLDAVKTKKCADLSAACQQAITAGVVSSALGAPHTYPTQPADQQNLASSVLLSTLPNAGQGWSTLEMCADSATPPVWAYRKHTAAQIQQVASDVKAAILALRVKYDGLQGKVAAAKTVAAVNAIAW